MNYHILPQIEYNIKESNLKLVLKSDEEKSDKYSLKIFIKN